MPDFSSNGASVHYELVGSGAPVLMIAGTASDSASWRPLTALLADRYRLILIDNRGAGRTVSTEPPTIDAMVGDCTALLDHLKLSEVSVIGHSLGGYLGLRLASTAPTRVRKLVTMTSGGFGPKAKALFNDLVPLKRTLPDKQWYRLLFQWLFSDPFFTDPAAVDAAADASIAYPFRQTVDNFELQVAALNEARSLDKAAIACPVLAIAAELDLLAPPSEVFGFHQGIPRLETSTISSAAHSVHWEAPQAVAEAITRFLG